MQDLPDEDVDRFLVDVGSATETDMKTTFERMRDRFEAEHGDALRAEGRAEGLAAILLRLLEQKFGDLPGDVTDRIRGAHPHELETWIDRVLVAETLVAVFETS